MAAAAEATMVEAEAATKTTVAKTPTRGKLRTPDSNESKKKSDVQNEGQRKEIGKNFFGANKEKGPRTVNDVKLINAGKILENNKTLSECKSPICDFSGMTTMHVVVRAPPTGKQSEKRAAKKAKDFRCGCAIM
nr:unnamed protein product [Digitaria exilis]